MSGKMSTVGDALALDFTTGRFIGYQRYDAPGQTTIAAGSNGATLPQATINVVSTTGSAPTGQILVQTTSGLQIVTFAGTTGTTYTGCAGGTGSMSTGGFVVFPTVGNGRDTYLALLSAAPGDGNTVSTMTEISTAGYARQLLLRGIGWTAASGQPASSSNSALITFGPFGAATPSIGWAALVSSSSGTTGDFIMYWTLSVAKTAATGESLQVAIGALTMTQA